MLEVPLELQFLKVVLVRKILIVEDEQILRETYEMILSSEPYIIFTAANGEEALSLCDEYTFDLILLDLMMPRVNGVQFLERFMNREERSRSKIIIISNLSSGENLTKAMNLGAHRSVVKADMSPRQLLSVVRYEVDASVA